MRLFVVSLLLVLIAPCFATSLGNPKNLSKKTEIQLLSPGVFQHISYFKTKSFGLVDANGVIVVDDNQAFLIDTGWSESDTRSIVSWIKESGFKLVGAIPTHHHTDRAGGLAYLHEEKVKTYAYEQTNTLLKSKGATTAQENLVGDKHSLFNGNIEVYYPGAGHTEDNIVIWLPKSKLLIGGCLIKALDSKTMGYIGEANMDEWAGSVSKLAKEFPGIEMVLPGHGKLGDADLLRHTESLVLQWLNESKITRFK